MAISKKKKKNNNNTKTFSQSRPLSSRAAASAALDILHDPERLAAFQPFIVGGSMEKLPCAPPPKGMILPPSPSPSLSEKKKKKTTTTKMKEASPGNWYQISELVPLLPCGLWNLRIQFYTWFRDLRPSSSSSSFEEEEEGGEGEGEGEGEGNNGISDISSITYSSSSSSSSPSSSDTTTTYQQGVETAVYAPLQLQFYTTYRIIERRRRKRATSHKEKGEEEEEEEEKVLQTSDESESESENETEWFIVEETTMSCPSRPVLWFSMREHRSAHVRLLDAVVRAAEPEGFSR